MHSNDNVPHDFSKATAPNGFTTSVEDRKSAGDKEAIAEYGDDQTIHGSSHLNRGLKARHIQFIALGGSIGTGLFLGIGSALTQAGPLSLLLGYTFTGIAIFAMMQCLGEMATYLPLPGAIPQICARYVDESLGFAVGWNTWYNAAMTLCAEISAASIVIKFWSGAEDINVAVWISIIIVLVLLLNIFAVQVYGEAEFIFASVKIVTIVGLIILALILDLGGGPNRDRLGFTYWQNPGAMKEYIGTGDTGRFLGLFSTLVNAAFSYGGVEMVAVTAGEAQNPRKNIPKAVRRVFWRILFFYVLGSLAIGVLVPYNDPNLLAAQESHAAGAARSPWVIAIYRAGIPVLPSIINAVILTSACSSANAFVYTGSRYLFALAQNRQAPKIFLKCTKSGVPIYAVGTTVAASLLTYLSVSSGSSQVFAWFQNLTTIASLFTWISISIAYIRFHASLAAQGVDRSTLHFKSPFQPYAAWFSAIFFSIIVIFQGFAVFCAPNGVSNWDTGAFVAAYVGIPLFFGLLVFWKIFKRTRFLGASETDLFSGKDVMDAMDGTWPEKAPRNFLEKVWLWVV